MAGNTNIPATPSDGNLAVNIVPAIADPEAPTVAELTAAGVEDISCYLTGDGWNPSREQASISDTRLCTTQDYEAPGRKTNGLEVTYIDNTNSEFSATNAAADTLIEGSHHFMVVRRGLAFDAPFEAGQKVEVWPVTAGMKRMVAPEANSMIRTVQKLFVTGDVAEATVAA